MEGRMARMISGRDKRQRIWSESGDGKPIKIARPYGEAITIPRKSAEERLLSEIR
jgi:hypothetical protein